MFDYIVGNVKAFDGNVIIVENNGIGYRINVSDNAMQVLYVPDNMTKIYTYLAVREDDISLFGFYSVAERDMFTKLTSVSGVGAKVALAILSGLNLEQLTAAIVNQDSVRLSTIKGIGKKTAERIVLELHEKVAESSEIPSSTMTDRVLYSETAVSALVNLGYSRAEATEAVKANAKNGMTEEEIIRAVLRGASNGK